MKESRAQEAEGEGQAEDQEGAGAGGGVLRGEHQGRRMLRREAGSSLPVQGPFQARDHWGVKARMPWASEIQSRPSGSSSPGASQARYVHWPARRTV